MSKPYSKMTAAELARATRRFEEPGEPGFLKPPASEKRLHDTLMKRAKHRRRSTN